MMHRANGCLTGLPAGIGLAIGGRGMPVLSAASGARAVAK